MIFYYIKNSDLHIADFNTKKNLIIDNNDDLDKFIKRNKKEIWITYDQADHLKNVVTVYDCKDKYSIQYKMNSYNVKTELEAVVETFFEMLAVLMIVSIIVIILSRISINTYEKYQERLAVNELVSEIYNVQTRSLNERRTFIIFFVNDDKYDTFYDDHEHWKKINRVGKPKLGGSSVTFEYRKGNLVSKANTVDVQFDNSRYRIIVHLDTGYITLDEV